MEAEHGRFGIDWYIRQKKIVHLPESVLIIVLYYLLSDSNNYCLTML